MNNDYTPGLDMLRYICTDPHAGNLIEPAEFDRAIAKIKAEAWEEGHRTGQNDQIYADTHDRWATDTPNPYKEEQA